MQYLSDIIDEFDVSMSLELDILIFQGLASVLLFSRSVGLALILKEGQVKFRLYLSHALNCESFCASHNEIITARNERGPHSAY